MAMLEQMRYATVTLELYQSERVDTQILADTDAWLTPGFGQRAAQSLSTGWQLLQGLFVAALSVWPLWLVLAAVWIVLRRRKVTIASRMKPGSNHAG